MGSLSASVKYERESHRLPPLDTERMTYMNRRRVEANAAVLRTSTSKLQLAGSVAKHQAERREAEMKAWAMMESEREMSLKHSKSLLTHSATTGSLSRTRSRMINHKNMAIPPFEKLRREAMRETALDCVRKEELARRTARAKSASDLAAMRSSALEMQREDERRQLQLRREQEAARLEAKMQVEQARLNRAVSFGSLREEEKQAFLKQKSIEDAKIVEERNARAQAREDRQKEKKQKEQLEEEARELSTALRRKEKKDMELRLTEVKAKNLAQRAENCWINAMAAEARAKSDVDAEENRVHLLIESGHATKLASAELDRLYRKLEMARMRVESALQTFQDYTEWAKNPSLPRPGTVAPARRESGDRE